MLGFKSCIIIIDREWYQSIYCFVWTVVCDRRNLTTIEYLWLGKSVLWISLVKNPMNNDICEFPFPFSVPTFVPIFLEFQLPATCGHLAHHNPYIGLVNRFNFSIKFFQLHFTAGCGHYFLTIIATFGKESATNPFLHTSSFSYTRDWQATLCHVMVWIWMASCGFCRLMMRLPARRVPLNILSDITDLCEDTLTVFQSCTGCMCCGHQWEWRWLQLCCLQE